MTSKSFAKGLPGAVSVVCGSSGSGGWPLSVVPRIDGLVARGHPRESMSLTQSHKGANIGNPGVFHSCLNHLRYLRVNPTSKFTHCCSHVNIRRGIIVRRIENIILQVGDFEENDVCMQMRREWKTGSRNQTRRLRLVV